MKRIFGLALCACILLCVCACLTSFASVSGQEIEDHIITKLFEHETRIELSAFEVRREELFFLWRNIIKGQPYLFFVDGGVEYDTDGRGAVTTIYPRYSMTDEEAEAAILFCKGEIETVAAAVYGMSEADSALWIHDYLCLQFEYDESLENDDLYLFLKNRSGTCQGYTYAYMAMTRAAGLECSFAASDEMSHIWNLLRVDDEWYHVDVTWDDYPEMAGCLEYESFLKSDMGICATLHKSWYSPSGIICTSNRFDNCEYTSPLLRYVVSGDIDLDGEVNVRDVVLFLFEGSQALLQKHIFFRLAADLDRDGELTNNDLELLLDSILG